MSGPRTDEKGRRWSQALGNPVKKPKSKRKRVAHKLLRRGSTITFINEKETDHLVDKMVGYLKSSNGRKKRRSKRRSSFWGFDKKGDDEDDTRSKVMTTGRVVDLEMSPEQVQRIDTLRAPNTEQGKLFFVMDTFIINPNSIYRQSWDIAFVMTSLLYTALRVPYAIAFDIDEFSESEIWPWFVFNRLVDLVFIMDMVIIMMTAIKDGRKLVTDRKLIIKRYLKGWFLFDFAASVPIDLILWIIMSGGSFATDGSGGRASRSAKLIRVIKIFRTLRIMRLIKMKRIVITLEIFLNLNFSVMSILKYAVTVFLLAHILACGFVGFGASGDTGSGWMKEVKELAQERQYVAAMYWAFTTMTTIGYGDIVAETQVERFWSIFCMVIGGVSFTYAITRIVHIVTSLGNAEKNLAEQLENVSEWANYHEFPDSLMADIRTYIHYKSRRSYYDEKSVLDGLSLSLKQKVLNFMFKNALKRVELFSNCSTLFLTELMIRMKSEFAAPFSLIIQENAVADSMYIVQRGFCAVYKGHERDNVQSAIIMGPGQAFGEIALLADNTTRTANVVALEWTDLAVIKRECFEELLVMFPREKFKMHKYVASKLDGLQKQEIQRKKTMQEIRTQTFGVESPSSDDDDDIARMHRESETHDVSYKDPLTPEKIKQMRKLEVEYAEDATLKSLDALCERTQSMKYQWLTHLDADRKNREYINALPDDEKADDDDDGTDKSSEDEKEEERQRQVLVSEAHGDFVNWDAIEEDKN